MKTPLLSIVIANYNYGRFLGDAIRSVITQEGFGRCELIVVDGGSADNSVEVIKKYEDKVAWWVSEKDKGQSDAFNKGFARARGKYLTWLNADDAFVPGALKRVVSYLANHPSVEWLSGGVVHCDAEMRVRDARIGATPPACLSRWFTMKEVGNPSTFFLKSRYEEVGGCDVDLHYIMDIDLWYKFFFAGMKLRHINEYIWAFRWHEQSKTTVNLRADGIAVRHLEERKILDTRFNRSVFKRRIGAWYWRIHKLLSGSYLASALDTMRYKNKSLKDLI